jgi:hypothetical protein
MMPQLSIDEVVPVFLRMSAAQRQLCLSAYTHEITILARAHFQEREFEKARLCNETIHRIAAYSMSLLDHEPRPLESSFIDGLAGGAVQRGWVDILVRSVELSRA